jgi:hypothetical protein
MEFVGFPKIPRLSRTMVITEKIDGTNAQIYITDDFNMFVGSRNKYITTENDNAGFAKWCFNNREELINCLGPGRHFGEWWGQGINRGYGLKEKRFSLFNTTRWTEETKPKCCYVVPILYHGIFNTDQIDEELLILERNGSIAAPGFMNPEGVIVYHEKGNLFFKKTIKNDSHGKYTE